MVIPDCLQEVPILIGKTFNEQPGLMVLKDTNSLIFTESQQPNTPNKIALWLPEPILIPSNHVGNLTVISKIPFQGDLYVEASFRCQAGAEYAISRILISLTENQTAVIPIINLSGRDLRLSSKHPLVRATAYKLDIGNGNSSEQVFRVDIDHLPWINKEDMIIGTNDVPLRKKLASLLQKYRDLFGTVTEQLGEAASAQMEIKLLEDKPFTYRPYRMAEKEKEKSKVNCVRTSRSWNNTRV